MLEACALLKIFLGAGLVLAAADSTASNAPSVTPLEYSRACVAASPSKLIFKVHQASIARVLRSRLSPAEISILQDAVREADDWTYQTVEMSFRHAMTPGGMSREEAHRKANDFVREELREAMSLKDGERRGEALRHLGFAMHAMQDSTSPAHHGFLEYYGGRRELVRHIWKELYDPGSGSWLDIATERAYMYFNGELPMPDDFFANLGAY